MKFIQNTIWRSATARTPYRMTVSSVVASVMLLVLTNGTLWAQDVRYLKPSLWIGAATAANFNFYYGSTKQLKAGFTAPVTFQEGFGTGVYASPLVEYHFPESNWGLTLQAGYDNRCGVFREQVVSPDNLANLSAHLSYITIEPGVRFTPFKSGFFLHAGPRVAFNLEETFVYQISSSTGGLEQVVGPVLKGHFSNINPILFGVQVGAGYDIPLSVPSNRTQLLFSPFVSFQPSFGQSPRSSETWTIANLRAGAALKIGCIRRKTVAPPATILYSPVQFTARSPRNIPPDRRVRETFPLRNYIFFDTGSSQIPARYVRLRQDSVKYFKENQLEVFAPKRLSGRSERGMIVYYNILNILGDRLAKNPLTVITLVGSSEKGIADGEAMAGSVKDYLTGTFGIDKTRIGIEGRNKPKIPSEKLGSSKELGLLREGDRRVSIESNSPALLMEFQSGPTGFLKPVETFPSTVAPVESYVSFHISSGISALSSWSLELKDRYGAIQSLGPYTEENVNIPGAFILGSKPTGRYKVTMNGLKKDGTTITKVTYINVVLWSPPQNEEGMRFSVIFEFDESMATAIYEKYLTDVLTPKVPKGGKVIIHGHTDIIGNERYNQKLSLARANEVKSILTKALQAAGRTDVKLEVHGWGENQQVAPFANKYPEERFYNRTVIIDIIPDPASGK